MSTRYHRRYPETSSAEGGPGWALAVAVLAAILLCAAAPALLIGFIAQRYVSRFPWSFGFWFTLLLPTCALFAYLYLMQGGEQVFIKELLTYALAIKHHQADFGHWPWRELWQVTWPMWIYTLAALPIWAFFLEVKAGAGGKKNTARLLMAQESRRERKRAANQKKASKRANQSQRIPDTAAGLMVIGVPIKEEEEK